MNINLNYMAKKTETQKKIVMKKWLLICSFVFLTNNLFCQSLEWEVLNAGLAFGFPEDKNGYYNPNGGAMTFGSAVRYKLKDKQLSTGFDFTFSGWNRYSRDDSPSYHQNAFVFLLTTDYNYIKINQKFIPFSGVGVGYSLIREWELWSFSEDVNFNKSHFAISPRVGFVVFKRLRFTTEYMYLGNRNNFFNFKLGFVIGS